MDLVLYNRVYKEGINKLTIIRYYKFVKPYKFYYLTTDYIQGN